METKEFTVEDGIRVQTNDLERWEKVLKPEVFEDLKKWVTKKNHLATNGYGICRGTYLANFVENYGTYIPEN